MDQMGGLIELVLVFGLVLGLGVYELVSVRRYKKSQAAKKASGETPSDKS